MADQTQHIDELIIKYLQRNLSVAEEESLQTWIASSIEHKQIFEQATGMAGLAPELVKLYTIDAEKGWQRIKANFNFAFAEEAPVIPMSIKFNWKKLAVAASIIGIIGIATYFIINNEKTIVRGPSSIVTTTDVAPPDKNRAMIKLADGTTVYLDSARNGELAMQGGVKVVKTEDGKIVYETTDDGPQTTVKYNTLNNPRGSKVIDMTLADGSRVWLNAGSSVTYPVAFAGNERKVSITGEAYFEVAHNAKMPFKVSKGEMEVTVLGTHFNVNAYDDEGNIKVTLLEGSVKVSSVNRDQSSVLKLGEQAIAANGGELNVVKGVDVEQVMSWKNGLFDFGSKTSLEEIMRQVARWYDVDVVYEVSLKENFGGSISRSVNVSEVLKKLELTGRVKFNVEGKKITVKK
jgi:transmembrane sensor